MSQNIDKFSKLLEWQQQYRRQQEKAQRATTYTTSSRSHRYSDKVKLKKVKFWNKIGKVGYNTEYNVYPESLVFGETTKIFEKIPQKRSRIRDNDEVSQSQDINQAVQNGIKKLKEEIVIHRAEEIIARNQEKIARNQEKIARNQEKKELKKTKLIMKQKK